MRDLSQVAQILSGVILDDDGDVDEAFQVLFKRLDDGHTPAEGNVHDVAPGPWLQADAIAGADGLIRRDRRLQVRRSL